MFEAASFSTIGEVLRARASLTPARRAFLFLPDGEAEGPALSYGELDLASRAFAGWLVERGLRGRRVLLAYPPGLDFLVAFYGCLAAGVVAVPCELPASAAAAARVQALAADAEVALRLTAAGTVEALIRLAGPGWTAGGEGPLLEPMSAAPGQVAFLQYTSGSTRTPRGVVVTHANVMNQQAAIRAAGGQGEEAVWLGWLPLFHDMGLMGLALQPIYAGASCVLMPPRAFLARPRRWLAAIGRYRATISGGPTFAFAQALARGGEPAGLALASWQVAYCGAEPVRAEVLARFATTYAPAGFDERALYPCYGLAEATAFVTGGPRDGLRVYPAGVGCGRPQEGNAVRVVDPSTQRDSRPGEEGEVWLAGPSVAVGYHGRPDDPAFGADGWLRTGDMGLVTPDGDLVVTGRRHDLIVVRGRNHHPQDVEATALAAHPALGHGDAAAFDQGGSAALVAEVRPGAVAEARAIAAAVRAAVAAAHGLALDPVAFVPVGALPRTSSGKLQRARTAAALAEGSLATLAVERRGRA